ncbi:MAG: fibronectin-binding SSURE repeat-containing protein [Streptococcus sp.]|nr:fibronectin-binding SSURE repeat-containing protein [Streptococcus sp.]
MNHKHSENNNELVRRWSLRKVSTGVASVVVAIGFFFLASAPAVVHADTPNEVVTVAETSQPEKTDVLFAESTLDNNTPVNVINDVTPISTDNEAIPKVEAGVTEHLDPIKIPEVSVVMDDKVADSVITDAKNAVEEVTTEVTPVQKVQDSVKDNIKESTDVPATFLTNAQSPGPFTAGVNQVIPYEFFGGDGMLTRLLLKSSDSARWSDNGTAKNSFLLPVEKLGNGQYFYQVALDGNAAGKQDKALLDQLQSNGTQDYSATVLVYGAKDGKADLNNIVSSRMVKVHLNGMTTVEQVKAGVAANLKESTDVPATFLTNAQSPGPFTAGVNQVIPYEFFGGDGMLTRLLLKSSDSARWSDNGTAKNSFLLPVEKLGNGQYFYQVALDGNAAGKQDKALLDQLQSNGTQDYSATVLVYGAKDGKADLNNIVAVRNVIVHLHGMDDKKINNHANNMQPMVKKHKDTVSSTLMLSPKMQMKHSGIKNEMK